VESLTIPTLRDLRKAAERIAGTAARTPLLRLRVEDGSRDLFLKPENLQPIGSFKIRGAMNAIASASHDELENGVFTASAGNMAQGVAWAARELGIGCSVVVPDHAPDTKLAAIDRLGGKVIKVPFDRWWDVMMSGAYPGQEGLFIHPVCDQAVITGNGTIGLEILEDLPDVDTVIVPFGGGGLSCGIAAALRAGGSAAEVVASEVATAAPLAAALRAGHPVGVEYEASFVDGIGSKGVLAPMWALVEELISASNVVSLRQISGAIRLLAERQRIIAEGAGASSVAAALAGAGGEGNTVCVISGGNIDFAVLSGILAGEY
jgi:threonine dehydratase